MTVVGIASACIMLGLEIALAQPCRDKCLEIEYHSGLFKKTCDGCIVDIDVDDTADDRTKTLYLQLPQLLKTSINNTTFIIGNLWSSVGRKSCREPEKSANLPSDTEDSISRHLICQLRTLISKYKLILILSGLSRVT